MDTSPFDAAEALIGMSDSSIEASFTRAEAFFGRKRTGQALPRAGWGATDIGLSSVICLTPRAGGDLSFVLDAVQCDLLDLVGIGSAYARHFGRSVLDMTLWSEVFTNLPMMGSVRNLRPKLSRRLPANQIPLGFAGYLMGMVVMDGTASFNFARWLEAQRRALLEGIEARGFYRYVVVAIALDLWRDPSVVGPVLTPALRAWSVDFTRANFPFRGPCTSESELPIDVEVRGVEAPFQWRPLHTRPEVERRWRDFIAGSSIDDPRVEPSFFGEGWANDPRGYRMLLDTSFNTVFLG